MSKLDKIKERIMQLRLWLGIAVVSDISVISWIVNNYKTAGNILFYAGLIAIIVLTVAAFIINKNISKHINSLEDL